jgi:hypothetical protein
LRYDFAGLSPQGLVVSGSRSFAFCGDQFFDQQFDVAALSTYKAALLII